jgi:hypothetical protein
MIRLDTGEVTMDRGPAALFGAIVAVGLGPAMWLGVRLGAVEIAPVRPPVVGEQTAGPEQLVGGSGAGDSPLDDATVKATPRATVLLLTTPPSPRAHTRTGSPPPSHATTSPTVSASPSGTGKPTTPPTESTGGPTTPPTTPPTDAPDPPPTTAPGSDASAAPATGDLAAGGPGRLKDEPAGGPVA